MDKKQRIQKEQAKHMVFNFSRLRERRVELSYSLEDVSILAWGKVNAMSLLGQYERGEAEPTSSKLYQLAVALEVELEYFFKDDEDEMYII